MELYEWEKPVMLEVTEQRPSPVTLAGILKPYSKFLSTLQTRNHEVNRQMFYSVRFSLEWQKQLCS